MNTYLYMPYNAAFNAILGIFIIIITRLNPHNTSIWAIWIYIRCTLSLLVASLYIMDSFIPGVVYTMNLLYILTITMSFPLITHAAYSYSIYHMPSLPIVVIIWAALEYIWIIYNVRIHRTYSQELPTYSSYQLDNTKVVSDIVSDPVDEECVVCLETYKTGDTMLTLECEHRFHALCAIPWIQVHGTCPICRSTGSALND